MANSSGCTLDLPTLSSGQAIPKASTLFLKDSYPVPTTHGMCMSSKNQNSLFLTNSSAFSSSILSQVHLQEEACLRISSFLADGIVVNPGDVLPDNSVNSLLFTLKELDVSVPLDMSNLEDSAIKEDLSVKKSFVGARLHIENLSFAESPTLKVRLLNLEKDPACFCLWPGQPIDASQKKWTAGASHFSLALETSPNSTELQSPRGPEMGLWNCVEGKDVSIEVAMVSADGKPLITIPPPGGIVRIGVACEQYISRASVEQLFFVLDLYSYFGKVSEKISIVKESKRQNTVSLTGGLLEKVPSDTAVKLALKDLQLKFLESSFTSTQDMPLVQFLGKDLSVKVTHRTLGGAVAVSSNIYWENIEVDCVDTDLQHEHENSWNGHLVSCNGSTPLRRIFWVVNGRHDGHSGSTVMTPFLDISITHVIPLSEKDMECHSVSIVACISGVRLGGGMSYAEALLQRFGILNLDGGPGEGLSRGLEHLSSGPLSKLFKSSIVDDRKKGIEKPILIVSISYSSCESILYADCSCLQLQVSLTTVANICIQMELQETGMAMVSHI